MFTIIGGEILSTVSDQMNPKNDLWIILISITKIICIIYVIPNNIKV